MSDEQDGVKTNIGEHEAPGAAALTTAAAAPAAGVGAPDEPDPILGTPRTFQRIQPPEVIHALGGARPGEANPASGHNEGFADPPTQDTAALLLDREQGEELLALPDANTLQNGNGDGEYAEQGYGGPTGAESLDDISGAHVSTDHIQTAPLQPGAGTFLATQSQFDQTYARVDAKDEANRLAVEQTDSAVGLPYERSRYEREELHTPTPASDLELVTDMRALPQIDNDSNFGAAVEDLDATGSTSRSSFLDNPRIAALAENGPAEAQIEQAGDQTYRIASTALPNDEDLPTTVAADTGEAPAVNYIPATSFTADERGGLGDDEDLVPRVQAPADPDIYSDFTRSDADYRTDAGEAAAQTGQPNPDIHKVSITDEDDGRPQG